MASRTNKLKIALWISAVYVSSFICYAPALLEQNGMIVPNVLLSLKYLYVCIPAIAAIFLLICEQSVKVYFVQMFSGKITIKQILIWDIYSCRNIRFLLLFAHSGNRRIWKYIFDSNTTINKLYIPVNNSVCWRNSMARISAWTTSL